MDFGFRIPTATQLQYRKKKICNKQGAAVPCNKFAYWFTDALECQWSASLSKNECLLKVRWLEKVLCESSYFLNFYFLTFRHNEIYITGKYM